MDVHPAIWVGFVGFVLSMLLLDLLIFHREAHEIGTREATTWVVVWLVMGLAFAGVIWGWQGSEFAAKYLAGYVLEKTLSMDNIFIFVLIFSYFAVPPEYQYRILFWGILGALFFRAVFISAGAVLLHRFEFMLYIFGAIVLITGVRMARHKEIEIHPEKNVVLRAARRLFPMTPTFRGQKFFTKENGRRMATPLFAVLLVVETTDIIFAVDSIPAIFGVTREPFLVFTSNAFAILGLRALYFLLANMVKRFRYLQVGLSVVLVFIGVKMLLHDVYAVPVLASLGVITLVLGASVGFSLLVTPPPQEPVGEESTSGYGESSSG